MEIIVNHLYECQKAEIFLKDDNQFFGYDGESIIRYEIQLYECRQIPMKPLLVVPFDLLSPMLKAISEYAKGVGVNIENENHLKGRLEATGLHLTDMRELTKMLVERQIKE